MAKSVFYDITDDADEATNLTARSLLMIAIEQRIHENRWTQTKAAQVLGVRQPRVSDLMNGKIDKFSLDALVNMLPAVGLTISVGPANHARSGLSRALSLGGLSTSPSRTQPPAAVTSGRTVKAAASAGSKRVAAKAGKRAVAKATKK